MQKKTQKWAVAIIVAVISITLIGSSFYALFLPETDQTAEKQKQETLEREYQERKLLVESLQTKLEANPEDTVTALALADAYFEKSNITVQLNLKEYQEDLQKAIDLYQKVLLKQDNNAVRLKLANSAFFVGQADLADRTYQQLLAKDPDNLDALYSYGLFLFYEKGDYKQAEANWQKAADLTSDENLKKNLEDMIALAKEVGSNAVNEESNEKKAEESK
ncbi:MAG TPA: tetratricopeptide repeat protein [Peptococcaceae bacterium]|nr:tetratricopeptide repeat protein [Peptococcaceae bacterium]